MIHRGFAIRASNKNSSQALAVIVKDAARSLSDWDNVTGDSVLLMKDLCLWCNFTSMPSLTLDTLASCASCEIFWTTLEVVYNVC